MEWGRGIEGQWRRQESVVGGGGVFLKPIFLPSIRPLLSLVPPSLPPSSIPYFSEFSPSFPTYLSLTPSLSHFPPAALSKQLGGLGERSHSDRPTKPINLRKSDRKTHPRVPCTLYPWTDLPDFDLA
jgi:hypothetical protein